MEPLGADEERLFTAQDAAREFAKRCRRVEENTPLKGETSLLPLVNYLMTELWDNGFSIAEIQTALAAAHADVVRYAGRNERNGSGIRGVSIEDT